MKTIEIDPFHGTRLVEHDLRLHGLQKAVGGFIEFVGVRGHEDLRLVIDEAGKLRKPPLPVNPIATAIAGIRADDQIVGRALVVRLTEDGDLEATDAEDLAAIRAALTEGDL